MDIHCLMKQGKFATVQMPFILGLWVDQNGDSLPAELTPERGALLPLRSIYGLFANLSARLVIFGPLADAASLKSERLKGRAGIS